MISENPLLLNMKDSDTTGPSSSPPFSSNTNLPMLYYGLVVIGTAAIVMAIYNLIVIHWCTRHHNDSTPRRTRLMDLAANHSYENQSRNLLSSFKYKKGSINMASEDGDGEYECAVCLSVFEDGDEVKQLPRCKHSFHAPCIDMWLYSHFDCPLCLCRTSVNPDHSPIHQRQREEFPGISVSV